MGNQHHAPSALPLVKHWVRTEQEVGWAPGTVWNGAVNPAPKRDSIPGSSSFLCVTIPTELTRLRRSVLIQLKTVSRILRALNNKITVHYNSKNVSHFKLSEEVRCTSPNVDNKISDLSPYSGDRSFKKSFETEPRRIVYLDVAVENGIASCMQPASRMVRDN